MERVELTYRTKREVRKIIDSNMRSPGGAYISSQEGSGLIIIIPSYICICFLVFFDINQWLVDGLCWWFTISYAYSPNKNES